MLPEALPVFALLSDFGLSDPYVGQMKAVLAALVPQAVQIDLCHDVAPHSVLQAAFFLAASLPCCPRRSIILTVVDPGVGSGRRILCCEIDDRLVLAPDNGLVPLALDMPNPLSGVALRDVEQCRFVDCSLTASEFRKSTTFHGRDVFAPLAARLAGGLPPKRLGPLLSYADLVPGQGFQASFGDGRLEARVLHVDRFGNLLLTARLDEFGSQAAGWRHGRLIHASDERPFRVVGSYAELDAGEIGLIAGSQGFLELAANQASASRLLGLSAGDAVNLEPLDD